MSDSRNLISPAALRARLGEPDLVLIDTRFSLQDKDYGRRAYTEAHLPGACYLDLEHDLSGPVGPHGGRHPLPEPEALAQALGRCGMGNDSEVVVYDDAGGMYAARLWWLLRWLGHESVRLLDGGLQAWFAADYPLSSEAATPIRRHFVPRPRPGMMLDLAGLRRELSLPGTLLLDARSPDRYRGETEPIDPKAGHIPGARNRPFADNLDQGRFKSPQRLRSELQAIGLGPAAAPIVYCGSGVTACHDLLALAEAGYEGRLYAGSWSDWCSYPENEIETGTART